MKKILIFFFCIFSFSAVAMEKSTTFNKDIFTKAQSEGKIVVVSSWIKYCSSCASQMKILQNAEKDFKNIQYLAFDVKNKENEQASRSSQSRPTASPFKLALSFFQESAGSKSHEGILGFVKNKPVRRPQLPLST